MRTRVFTVSACALFMLGFARCSTESAVGPADVFYSGDPCRSDQPDAPEFSVEGGVPFSDATSPDECIGGPSYWCKDCGAGLDFPYGCTVTIPQYCEPLVCTCKGNNYWQCPL